MYTIYNVINYLTRIQEITNNDESIAREMLDKSRKQTDLYTQKKKHLSYDEAIALKQIDKLEYLINEVSKTNDYPGQTYKSKTKSDHYKFYYRGHYKTDYVLTPSVFRSENWDKEDYYYHEIMVRCPDRFQFITHLDKLVLMQHYDCPTRLLDVTSNPLVALYFACKNFGCKACSNSDEGTVYVFTKLAEEVVYSDSDKALMLSCLAKFSLKDKERIVRLCLDNLPNDKFPQTTNSRYRDDVIERFYYEVTTEVPAFKREIKPIDLLQPLFVQPNKANGRILKQDGAFILSGLSENPIKAQEKLEAISYTALSIKNQQNILRELEQLEIHEASLFPEVDKVANYLKER